jgi:hypothetical protein
MGRLLNIAKAALAEIEMLSAGQPKSEPARPSRTGMITDRQTESESARPSRELKDVFQGSAERAEVPKSGVEFPTRRCRACNSWLFWVSVYGAVMCSTCHPPASPDLLKSLYWLPEGEGKRIQ